MIRIGRGLVVLEVTVVARRAERGILPARMTLRASRGRMRAGERKSGRVVIERGRCPIGGRVTQLAALRETGGGVIRRIRGLIVLEMAGYAVRADIGVVAIGVALQAIDVVVRARERERGEIVVESGSQPC